MGGVGTGACIAISMGACMHVAVGAGLELQSCAPSACDDKMEGVWDESSCGSVASYVLSFGMWKLIRVGQALNLQSCEGDTESISFDGDMVRCKKAAMFQWPHTSSGGAGLKMHLYTNGTSPPSRSDDKLQ